MAKRDDNKDDPDCSNCRFFVEVIEPGETERWGYCHAGRPQAVVNGQGDIECVTPWTHLPHWCGEHKPRLQ
jgi:hypothetical protein